MTLTFEDARIQNDNGVWLCLKVNEPAPARRFVMEKQARLYDVEIKQHRDKRSLDANRFFWHLIGELSKELGEKEDKLYLDYVRGFGMYRDWPLDENLVSTFQVAWSKQGKGWPAEILDYTPDGERIIVRAYYGSSTYNSKQMSRLIDAVVQDCESLGIETLTQEKLDLLKRDWKGALQ